MSFLLAGYQSDSEEDKDQNASSFVETEVRIQEIQAAETPSHDLNKTRSPQKNVVPKQNPLARLSKRDRALLEDSECLKTVSSSELRHADWRERVSEDIRVRGGLYSDERSSKKAHTVNWLAEEAKGLVKEQLEVNARNKEKMRSARKKYGW